MLLASGGIGRRRYFLPGSTGSMQKSGFAGILRYYYFALVERLPMLAVGDWRIN